MEDSTIGASLEYVRPRRLVDPSCEQVRTRRLLLELLEIFDPDPFDPDPFELELETVEIPELALLREEDFSFFFFFSSFRKPFRASIRLLLSNFIIEGDGMYDPRTTDCHKKESGVVYALRWMDNHLLVCDTLKTLPFLIKSHRAPSVPMTRKLVFMTNDVRFQRKPKTISVTKVFLLLHFYYV
jgi:hypothetical protein